MHGHTVHDIDGLKARSRALQSAATRLVALRDQAAREKAQRLAEIEHIDTEAEVLSRVTELYRVLMDRMVLSQVKVLESLVSEGLKAIFFDQDLSFIAELGQKYNRVSVDLFLAQGDPEKGGIKAPPLESFGGGPSSVVSLVLRVIALLRTKRFPLLLLDETLAAVSDDYVEMTGKFLDSLAQKSKLDVLLVTHKPSFLDHAAVAYQGDAGADGEFSVRRLKGRP